MTGWETVDAPGGVHISPADDLIRHRMSRSCFCAPEVSVSPAHDIVVCRQGEDRPVQYVREVLVHNAMDGRE